PLNLEYFIEPTDLATPIIHKFGEPGRQIELDVGLDKRLASHPVPVTKHQLVSNFAAHLHFAASSCDFEETIQRSGEITGRGILELEPLVAFQAPEHQADVPLKIYERLVVRC